MQTAFRKKTGEWQLSITQTLVYNMDPSAGRRPHGKQRSYNCIRIMLVPAIHRSFFWIPALASW
ncbi:hypothetical protein OUY_00880 [Wolbachia endosymbiont of Leptopilina clavipes]|nr:hypothetical protein OUY_00880 [Wolbachia endosymbiont of Leptopilina clavipes]